MAQSTGQSELPFPLQPLQDPCEMEKDARSPLALVFNPSRSLDLDGLVCSCRA